MANLDDQLKPIVQFVGKYLAFKLNSRLHGFLLKLLDLPAKICWTVNVTAPQKGNKKKRERIQISDFRKKLNDEDKGHQFHFSFYNVWLGFFFSLDFPLLCNRMRHWVPISFNQRISITFPVVHWIRNLKNYCTDITVDYLNHHIPIQTRHGTNLLFKICKKT